MFQNIKLLPRERSLKSIRKSDKKMAFLVGSWRPGDDANGTSWMNERIAGPANPNEGHDLGPSRNIVSLVRHLSRRIAANAMENRAFKHARDIELGTGRDRDGREVSFAVGSQIHGKRQALCRRVGQGVAIIIRFFHPCLSAYFRSKYDPWRIGNSKSPRLNIGNLCLNPTETPGGKLRNGMILSVWRTTAS